MVFENKSRADEICRQENNNMYDLSRQGKRLIDQGLLQTHSYPKAAGCIIIFPLARFVTFTNELPCWYVMSHSLLLSSVAGTCVTWYGYMRVVLQRSFWSKRRWNSKYRMHSLRSRYDVFSHLGIFATKFVSYQYRYIKNALFGGLKIQNL